MFKLKTMTIEINNTANSDTITLTTTEGLNIENLINFLNNTEETKKLKLKETWEKAFNRCSKQSLNLIEYIFLKKLAFGEGFPVCRESLLKDLKVKPEGLNGRIGSINRCFDTLNKSKPVIIFNRDNNSYDIDSNNFLKHWNIFIV